MRLPRKTAGTASLIKASAGSPLFYGRDINPKSIIAARTNLQGSLVSELYSADLFDLRSGDFFKDRSPLNSEKEGLTGLIAVNPPYGERLNKNDDMLGFYARMGDVFKQEYRGWKISILTGHRELSDAVGLRADKLNTVYNGGIRCTLAHFRIFNDNPEQTAARPELKRYSAGSTDASEAAFPAYDDLSPGSQMMYNRLKKNAKQLKSWLKNNDVSCYRLYDADMPEYSVAVDIYPPEVVIQEYSPPKTIDTVAAANRLREAVAAVQSWLQLPESSVKLKQRKKQRGSSQYERNNPGLRLDPIATKRIISEHGLKFFIDTSSYLDTGIFLDSRPIRALIRNEAEGKSFLNLFCYTATASVYASAGGALSTTSVDTSKTYP